ncbi:DNA-dependent metalloprotease WSS1 [Yarrowia sp. B02]|nr:DNA-dependent metalloprotease WSS1 [Yarrowia sp. B02]
MEFISNITVLKKRPGSEHALEIITRAARFVQPIMKNHGFKVGTLCEMFPKHANLLGLNVNHGQKVCLRLRQHYDDKMFLPFESIMGTLLHELCHNKYGPHNAQFYAYLKELEDDYYALKARGFTPDTPFGFLGPGKTLGSGGGRTLGGPARGIAGIPGLGARPGRAVPTTNAPASKVTKPKPGRPARFAGTGKVLGSSTPSPPPLPGRRKPRAPTREQILAAVEKRIADTKWCASENAEISKEVDENDDDVVFLGEKASEIEVIDLT